MSVLLSNLTTRSITRKTNIGTLSFSISAIVTGENGERETRWGSESESHNDETTTFCWSLPVYSQRGSGLVV